MPEWRDAVRRHLAAAGLRPETEVDVVEELAQHLDDRYAELRARGLSDADARRITLQELDVHASVEGAAADADPAVAPARRSVQRGDLGTRVRRSLRPAPSPAVPVGARSGAGALGSLGGDVRFAFRMLGRSPGFTIVAALVIALGIGANTTIFSVLNAVLLRPLPGVRAPGELAAVYTSDYSGPRFGASAYPDFLAMRESGAFASMAAYAPRPLSILTGERGVQVLGEVVSANYFEVLGVRPAHGRFFLPAEGGPVGSAPVVVLGHDFWQSRLGGAPDVVGSSIRVNGQMLTVIGVAPASFVGSVRGVRMDAWIAPGAPEALIGGDFSADAHGSRGLLLVGRLADGATLANARTRLAGVAAQQHAAYPDFWSDINDRPRVITVLPEAEARVPPQMRSAVLGFFALLMAVVGIVLLIACTNVANLMLVRASARRAEMGVRIALGASRGRIVRQLLVESVLLSLVGGAIGVIGAVWLTRLANAIRLPVPVPVALEFPLDVRVAAFAAVITMATGVLFGTLPALQSSRAPAPMMKDATAAPHARMRLRNALVVVQVAASLVLLAGGGVFLRSLLAAQRIDPGIDTRNMVLLPFDLASEGMAPEEARRLHEALRVRVAALPGVTSATLAERVPLGLGWSRRSVNVDGYAPAAGEDMEIPFNGVSAGYFEAMGIRMTRGRRFTDSDRADAPPVVVVNEAFARRFWPGRDPLGMRVGVAGRDAPMAEVVGVVPDAKYRSLTEEPTPYFYYPYAQRPARTMTLQVRTALDPDAIVPAVRATVRAIAPALPMPAVTTLRQHVALATLPQRIAGAVLAVLGVIALAIAAIGLYGVVTYTVAQRTREFGIRTALGAAAADVRRMVLAQGMRLALIGAAIGTALALVLTRLIRSMLLVSPFDPVAIGAGFLVLITAAALASWLPAHRATRIDPVAALKE